MPQLFLFCLVLGAGLLLLSVLDVGGDGDAPDSPDGGSDAAWFLSLRTLVYFLAGFGGTGLLLDTLTAAGPVRTVIWAAATGLSASAIAALSYGWLRRSESGVVPADSGYLVGVPARVLLPLSGSARGKIVALHHGREVELLARLFAPEDGICGRNTMVVIVDVQGDTALVTPMPSLDSPLE